MRFSRFMKKSYSNSRIYWTEGSGDLRYFSMLPAFVASAELCGSRSANGVIKPPNINEAWTHYRRHIAYPLLIWLTNHTTHQPEENCCVLCKRSAIAAEDFDLFNFLKD